MLSALGSLWLAGVQPNWKAFHAMSAGSACRCRPIHLNESDTGLKSQPSKRQCKRREEARAGYAGKLGVIEPSTKQESNTMV